MISNNNKLKVDVFFREFRMTVRQLLAQFGERLPSGDYDWSNFSDTVRSNYDAGNYEAWVDVCHVIRPNPNYDEKKLLSKYKRFSSCYYEKGNISAGNVPEYTMSLTDREKDKVLSEKGYDYFPVLCPRWETTGEDVYGTSCPGMEALGDVKALQLLHKRKAQAIEKMVNPPLVGPSSLKSTTVSILPGNITYQDMRDGQSGLKPIHEVKPDLQYHVLDIQEHQNRIRRVFYEDLFLMMAQSDRREITAREIDERHEEKLLALGPVLEQLNQDLLDPLIDITFDIMLKRDMIPEAPEELQGSDLRVEYISVMAQAQKLVGISSIERFSGFVGNIATTTQDMTTLDKVDIDQMIDEYGDALSMPPRVIRPDDAVEEIRAGRAKAVQAQAAQDAMANTAKTAKDLSGADTGGDNALTRLMQAGKAGNAVPQQ